MAKKKPTDPPNSPITVGGGAGKKPKLKVDTPIHIKFDHDDYLREDDEYSSPILALDYVTLNGNRVGQVDEGTEVEIKYKKTLDHKITINKDGQMGVKFKGEHFPYAYGGDRRHEGRGVFKRFKVGDDEIEVPNPERFTIVCYTKLKTRKSSKTRKKR